MTTDLARKAAELASYDVGERETDGTNDSPKIRNKYLGPLGLAPPSPYCASACSCWVREAGKELGVVPRFKSSGSAVHLFERNPDLQFFTLTPDDLPCIGINRDADKVHGHAFMAIGLDESTGQIQSIDPNSNPAGGREGTGVWALGVRNVHDPLRLGYLRIE
jgi:hypothetical protein